MYNQTEIENSIQKVLVDKSKTGTTVLEDEVQHIIDGAVRKLSFRFGIAVIVISFSFGIWITTIQLSINSHERQLSQGDRYTQEEHNAYSTEVDRRFNEVQASIVQLRTDYKEDVTDIKNDVRYIRERLSK